MTFRQQLRRFLGTLTGRRDWLAQVLGEPGAVHRFRTKTGASRWAAAYNRTERPQHGVIVFHACLRRSPSTP